MIKGDTRSLDYSSHDSSRVLTLWVELTKILLPPKPARRPEP